MKWWSGVSGGDIVAGAVQAMPTSLRTKRTPLLVYQIQVGTKADPVVEEACDAEGTRLGGAIVRRIARTLRVAAGPAVAEPPFLPIA